jgi:8-oxo-dGTP pyrophosphatase MutT (NUDIX family)
MRMTLYIYKYTNIHYDAFMSAWSVKRESVYPKGNNPFGNPFYGYRKIDLTLPEGREASYYGVVVPPCVHVVALEDDETTYLVRQQRPNTMPLGGTSVPETLELPGGFAHPAQTLVASAAQELREETGRDAASMRPVGTLYPSTGVSSEQDHIFIGTELSAAERPNDQEITEIGMGLVSGRFGDLYMQMLTERLPVSAQTLAAMAKVANLL